MACGELGDSSFTELDAARAPAAVVGDVLARADFGRRVVDLEAEEVERDEDPGK